MPEPGMPQDAVPQIYARGQKVVVEAEILESYPGDSCVRIEVGDRRARYQFWVRTGTVRAEGFDAVGAAEVARAPPRLVTLR